MATYQEVIADVLKLGYRKVLTSAEKFEELKENYTYGFEVQLDVIARCGHKMEDVSLYHLEARKNAMCDGCENIDFEEKYKLVKQRFESLSPAIKLVTTMDEMIFNTLGIDDAYKLEISNCANRGPGPHLRESRYSDIKDTPADKIYCAKCSRKLRDNGNIKYETLDERFAKFGCKLLTTKEEYEENNMSSKVPHKFIASCTHTMEAVPEKLELQRRKTNIKCPDCK